MYLQVEVLFAIQDDEVHGFGVASQDKEVHVHVQVVVMHAIKDEKV